MIASLSGFVELVRPEFLILNVNDVGYQIMCPNPFAYEPNSQEKTKVYTYQYVREDIISLYGFKHQEERNLFSRLLQVTGIGPKGALAIIASGQPEQVVHAIESEDEAFLIKFPGVGKKTARQMILDLKGKLQDIVGNMDIETIKQINKSIIINQSLEDAVEALKALGYAEKEIKKIRPVLNEKEMTTDQYIKAALQMFLK